MDIPWDDARLFLAVAESGSLSAAARTLRIAQPTVSRRLAELESRLGEPVFTRGTEGARLTSFGERLVIPARRMAEAAAELERAAEKRETALGGVVRVTAPPGFAADFCVPFAVWLRTELPGVRLEIVSSVRSLDLVRREADLALRIEPPQQRDLISVASAELRAVAHATPEYAARLGRRPHARDVDWVGWAPPLDDVQPNPILARQIPGWQPAFASDDYLVQLRAAEAGMGAILLGRVPHRFASSSPLVPLELEGIHALRSSLHLLASRSALEIPRVAKVAELLGRDLRDAETRRRAPPKTRRRRAT